MSFLRPESLPGSGLPSEAVVGTVRVSGHPIRAEDFEPNPVFVRFLHYVIAKHGSKAPGFVDEAKRQLNGWIYIIDRRIGNTDGRAPLEDIPGWFEIRDGKAVSYRANPQHLLLTDRGFLKLDPWISDRLAEEAAACG